VIKRQIVLVTPKLATEWLGYNSDNRKVNNSKVAQYSADMRAGNWGYCDTSIVFLDTGKLASGQHRLLAVIASGVSIEFQVVRGVAPEYAANIDRLYGRSDVDNARMTGLDPDLDRFTMTLSLAIFSGDTKGGVLGDNVTMRPTDSEKYEMRASVRKAVEWTIEHGPKGRSLKNAVVYAAIARAWMNGVEEYRLLSFINIIQNPHLSEGARHSAAVLLFKHFAVNKASSDPRGNFLRTQNMIRAFVAERSRDIVTKLSEEPYPLPAAQMILVRKIKENHNTRTIVAKPSKRDGAFKELDSIRA
jgi:hypothetical protein